MATCSVQALMQNPCFCKVTVSPRKIAKLALLCQIYNAVTMATCDVPTLMDRAKCFCPVTVNPVDQLELQLLCEISSALGGGGSGGAAQVSSGNGAPTSTPAGGVGIYLQKDSVPAGVIWEYYDGAWH